MIVDQPQPPAVPEGQLATGDRTRCPACGSGPVEIFHRQESVPSNSCLLLEDATEARQYPTGSLALGFCGSCGFVTNTAFDARLAEYSSRYEETQAFSGRFVEFARDLAARWVERYDLQGRDVLEIGCGKGEFLVMMVEAGIGRGIGVDPGVHPERIEGAAADRITWIPDFYSERYAHVQADAIVCRHTLEHIQPVGSFMRMVRRAIGDRTDTAVLFELPDVLRVLREAAFWDVYYEHCSYFSAGSLGRLFRATGFEVLDLALDYDDQYLLIEAKPATTPAGGGAFALEDDLGALAEAVEHFRSGFDARIGRWRAELESLRQRDGRAVIWGAGSKGVAYLTALGSGTVEYAVDINPFKHGKYMAGTGQRIVAPDFLREYRPDTVIAMNPIYRDEIQRTLVDLGLDTRLEAV